jgi:hypothetical protein
MNDGAPARFSRAVRDAPSNSYHDGWVGRAGPTFARFESSGFVPVGKPKTLVYVAPVDNEEALHHRMWMPVRLSATTPASFN